MSRNIFWLFSTLILFACDPLVEEFDAVEPAEVYHAAKQTSAPAAPAQLTVMTYNIKFGGGRIDFFFDCHGDRVLMTRAEVLDNLDGVARKIRQVNPDILFLQEVDVGSKRAAFVDQLQWLLDHTDLNHGYYASQWRVDFVPSDGLGPVDSGNAILSKYPLSEGTRLALPLRSDQGSVDRYFYLRRNILTARTKVDGRNLFLVATHASAYSQDGTKKKQIDRFKQELDGFSERGLVIGGGDLNALPPGSTKLKDFPDSVCTDEDFQADDYSEERDWLDDLYRDYAPAIALAEYQQDNRRFFTHTTDGGGFWNRKLDYLFTNGQFIGGLVHQDRQTGGMNTMPLSDHAPMSVTLELQ